jgi:hypothetical protein
LHPRGVRLSVGRSGEAAVETPGVELETMVPGEEVRCGREPRYITGGPPKSTPARAKSTPKRHRTDDDYLLH